MSWAADRRRGVKPARCSAGQKRLPGRAKWCPTRAEVSDGLMPAKRTRSPGATTSRSTCGHRARARVPDNDTCGPPRRSCRGLTLVGEVVRVLLDVVRPLVGDLVLGEAGVH